MCCGRNRVPAVAIPNQLRTPADQRPFPPSTEAQFEYTGKTALTVVSPLTGRKYSFPQPQARVSVDLRDRSWIAFVPHLKRCG